MWIIPRFLKTPATDGLRMAPLRSAPCHLESNRERASAASPLVVRGTDLKKGGQRPRTSSRRDQSPIRPFRRPPLETGNSPATEAALSDDATAGSNCLRRRVQPIGTRGRYSPRYAAD